MSQPTELAALPQSLVINAANALHVQDWMNSDPEQIAKVALQAAGLPALLQELRNIAFNCKDCDADEYRDWAQSRARHTLRQVLGVEVEEAK